MTAQPQEDGDRSVMAIVPVTLVIPTLNGGPLLRRSLEALGGADPRPAHLLVIDSGSVDGSDRWAAEAGAEVVRIERSEFDHGATRQQAAKRATTEFVAFLSQDAIPEPGYLEPLVAAFAADANLAGASARILPHADSSFLTRRTVLASPLAAAESRTVAVDPARFAATTGAELRALLMFDNVASLARRETLLRHPFPRTMMGEDAAYAVAVLAAGMRLRFVAEAVVHHAHEYGPVSAFRRYRDDARWLRRFLGFKVRAGLPDLMRGFLHEVREDVRGLRGESLARRASSLARSPFLRLGQVAGQWWGSNSGARS